MQRFYCDNCGTKVDKNSSKCPNCGRFFRSVKCPICGFAENPNLFINGCPKCGYAGDSKQKKEIAKEKNHEYNFFYGRFYRIILGVLSLVLIFLLLLLIKTAWN